MTFKEELEILRGEPIQGFNGDPLDIPCIETSDPVRLCQHPVVSVSMITYNHEPYIRQAIEGVMMQKTNFEFELVIGEDCSTDKTREICFEYQKRYPDKIRVLWWHENLYRNPHPAGGNSRRNQARSRGEFIALCEGDDYWIDPLKLQKQVDVMRKHPNVSLCFCGSKIYHGATDSWEIWDEKREGFASGIIPRDRYLLGSMFGLHPLKGVSAERFQMTATFMARASSLKKAWDTYDIFKWRLRVGDGVFSMGAGSMGDAYYLPDIVSVYRHMPSGMSSKDGYWGVVDTLIIRAYYFINALGLDLREAPIPFICNFLSANFRGRFKSAHERREYLARIRHCPTIGLILSGAEFLPTRLLGMLGLSLKKVETAQKSWLKHFHALRLRPKLQALYDK